MCSILMKFPPRFFIMHFISVHVVQLHSSIDTAIVSEKSSFILSDRSNFHMINNLSIAFHTFRQVNKPIKKGKKEKSQVVIPNLSCLSELSIIEYSDASFANLDDGGSQGGYIIFIVGKNENVSHSLLEITFSGWDVVVKVWKLIH